MTITIIIKGGTKLSSTNGISFSFTLKPKMSLGMRLHKRKRSGHHFEGVKIEKMVKTVFTNRLD